MLTVVIQTVSGRRYAQEVWNGFWDNRPNGVVFSACFDEGPHLGCNAHTIRTIERGLALSADGTMVLLEDDCVPSPDFLEWAEWAKAQVISGVALTACGYSRFPAASGFEKLNFLYDQPDAATAGFCFGGAVFTREALEKIRPALKISKDRGITVDKAVDLLKLGPQIRPVLSRIRNIGEVGVNTPGARYHREFHTGDVSDKKWPGGFRMADAENGKWLAEKYSEELLAFDRKWGRLPQDPLG